ncbi:MAG: bifunctional acetate--CoA ligase family protein/GNAT family N-acetyltransferase [Bacteroidota bacterium]
MRRILDKFFQPKSIAVIGATNKPEKVGFAVLQNLLPFNGKIYPVNPKYTVLMDLPCYKRVKDLPEIPDMVIIVTPAETSPALIAECGKAGVECAVIISSGFKEAGDHGERIYRDLLHSAAQYKVRIIGPNCMGLLVPSLGLNATFASAVPGAGRVAFISQSGALGAAVMDWAADKNVGFSYFVSMGNMADISFEHLIDYFGQDSRTSCILIYMEHLTNARKFMSAARAFARSKPIVILKAGTSREGARAAMLHTGAQAGNDAAYESAFRRSGLIRVRTIQQFFDCTQALATQPLPAGKRLAIVTNAGGPGIIATDALIRRGGTLSYLRTETIEKLNTQLSSIWSKANPVDMGGDATPEHFRNALRTCLFDPEVDAVLVILTAQQVTDAVAVAEVVVAESKAVFPKPVYAAWMGQKSVIAGRIVLEKGKVPWYPFPERAVEVFMHMADYKENLDLLFETPPDQPIGFADIRRAEASALIEQVRQAGRTNMDETESKQLLACYGIPVNIGLRSATEEEAVRHAHRIGYPVVMKIESPDIWQKTEIGGVKVDIENDEELRQTFRMMIENTRRRRPDARIKGVTIEKMQSFQHEVLIGAGKDPVFGPLIHFGLGGVAAELWQDRTVGLPPLNLALAKHLVEGTKVSQLLKGYRALKGVPIDQLQDVICRFAYLLMDFPDIRTVEVNPFAMNADGGIALDAAVSLERNPSLQRNPYDHLSILPYPTQWTKTVRLKNKKEVLFRPIRSEDEPMEAELAQKASRESLYFRFFGYVPGIDHRFLSRLTHIDYDREMAIVAQVEEDGVPKIVGEVRIVGDGWRESAEYAILVADKWHGLGLGGMLTDFIIEVARAQGYKTITASFLKYNGSMRRLFERKGFTIGPGDEDSDYANLALQTSKKTKKPK